MGMILRIASSRIVGVRGYERMCTRKKTVERLSCGFEDFHKLIRYKKPRLPLICNKTEAILPMICNKIYRYCH